MNEARVVGTTLSKLFMSPSLARQSFDILIVDEASMVPMPHLYFALSKITTGVTLVGDFNQLAPIVLSGSSAAKKWLGESIFDELKINTVEKAKQTALVSMLDIQYRMAPEIAQISSELFYGGLLRSAESACKLGLHDSIFGESRIVIVDTSQVDPWCTQAPGGSRLNVYSAGLAITQTERLLREHPEISVGVAVPYKPQAQFIAKAVNESEFGDRALVSTVHSFQGGECTAIIFDCVDGQGSARSSLQDSFAGKKSNAAVMLNVALTRARALYVILINKQYFDREQKGSTLCRLVDALSAHGVTINARDLDGGFISRPVIERLTSTADTATTASDQRQQNILAEASATYNPAPAQGLYSEKDFWTAFNIDLAQSQHAAIIVSPFLTTKRSQDYFVIFEKLVNRGVKLQVITKPSAEHRQDHMAKDSENVIEQLHKIGVKVVQIPSIHQKVVIIDDFVCWEGSLNILSQRDSLEHMRRFESRTIAAELRRNLRLE